MYTLTTQEFYELIRVLKKYSHEIEWVKIFGSRARGDNKEISDIDLAVKFRKDILAELNGEFFDSWIKYTVDIIDYDKILNSKLKAYVDTEGKEIFSTFESGGVKININKLFDKYEDYKKALIKLEEALTRDIEKDDIYLDGTIQRFEFVYELSWKLMKNYLEFNGVEVNSPREAFRESFKVGIIADAGQWIKMLENRNRTSHTYDESTAREIYDSIKKEYINLFNEFSSKISKKI